MERIKMHKVREIIKHSTNSGLSQRKIAKALSVSRPVVSDYIRKFKASKLTYDELDLLTDDQILKAFHKSKPRESDRYKQLIDFYSYVSVEIKKTGVRLYGLWEEYREQHQNEYSYSQFCYYYQL